MILPKTGACPQKQAGPGFFKLMLPHHNLPWVNKFFLYINAIKGEDSGFKY